MIKYLSPPETKYSSLEDVGKFNMIWSVSMILVPVFLFLIIMHLYFKDVSWTTSLAALLVAVLNLIVMYTTRKYEIVGVWSVILSILVVQASIFIIEDSHLIADTLWCILSAFFTYFIFNTLIGTLVLLLNLAGLTIYLLNGSTHDVLAKGISVEEVDIRMVVNVFYVSLALAFVIYKIMDNNKKINDRYEQQIRNNEVLIKEVHHRVKNNLQIISSLLRLQSAESRSKVVHEHFDEAIGRIRSMALIHEKMYQQEDLSQIELEGYLVSLAGEIVSSIQSDTNIEVNVKSDVHDIDPEQIVPLSLIFNELITNSIKHGFQNKTNGEIQIEIIIKDESVEISYADNGAWQEPQRDVSFGLELLMTLTEQLDGKFTRSTEKGTSYLFTIPLKRLLSGK